MPPSRSPPFREASRFTREARSLRPQRAPRQPTAAVWPRSEEHTSELQSQFHLHSFPTRRSSDLQHLHTGLDADPDHEDRHIGGHGEEPVRHDPAECRHPDHRRSGKRRALPGRLVHCDRNEHRDNRRQRCGRDRKSTRLNSSHSSIYTLSLHDALPIFNISTQDWTQTLTMKTDTLAVTAKSPFDTTLPNAAIQITAVPGSVALYPGGSFTATATSTATTDGSGVAEIGRAHV